MRTESYQQVFTKFITSQHWHTGVRMTFAVLLPVLILQHFQWLQVGMVFPLGTLCISLTDLPGPYHHRVRAMAYSLLFNLFAALLATVSNSMPWLIVAELAVLGMFFSLLGVYGNRVNSIGLIAILVFIFHLDTKATALPILQELALFTAGGIWYLLLCLILYKLRPFKIVQQLLGESVMEIADYLHNKAAFYSTQPDYDVLFENMMKHQVTIHQRQEELREILFKTRLYVNEATKKGRIINLLFLDSVDLFERVFTSPPNYQQLQQGFASTGLLPKVQRLMLMISAELKEIGLAIQMETAVPKNDAIPYTLTQLLEQYFAYRDEHLTTENVEHFIALRNVLHTLEDVVERVQRLQLATGYTSKSLEVKTERVNPTLFVQKSEIHPQLLWNNLSFQSGHFRHAIRVTIALIVGYCIAWIFNLGHGYWILLTIITIIKPSFSITATRNWHRLGGTLLGSVLGVVIIYGVADATAQFVCLIIAMLVAYSFLRLHYFVSTVGITIYVLLTFDFLQSVQVRNALSDRVLDTIIGSVVALLVSRFVLPYWEASQIKEKLLAATKANAHYFTTVAQKFTQTAWDISAYKNARKNAFIALANLSDTFQRMLSEPKETQQQLAIYHPLVTSNHILTSYVASLSYYAQRRSFQFEKQDFEYITQRVQNLFAFAEQLLESEPEATADTAAVVGENKLQNKVQQLLESRKKAISQGFRNDESSLASRRILSDLKSISDQFELVATLLIDQIKLIKKLPANTK